MGYQTDIAYETIEKKWIMFSNKTNNTDVQVDLSGLADATYLVKVISDDKEKVIKVIKKG